MPLILREGTPPHDHLLMYPLIPRESNRHTSTTSHIINSQDDQITKQNSVCIFLILHCRRRLKVQCFIKGFATYTQQQHRIALSPVHPSIHSSLCTPRMCVMASLWFPHIFIYGCSSATVDPSFL